MIRPLLLFLLALSACAREPSRSAPGLPRTTSIAPAPPAPDRQEVRLTLRAPGRATYNPEALGLGGQFVVIRLENLGPRAVWIAPLRVAFSAWREGVAFPCQDHVGGSARVREPSWLSPGQSFAFERDIDCMLPLPGTYEITVSARLGDAPVDPAAQGLAGSFRLELEPGHRSPRALPSRAGLFAVMTGSRATRPMSPEAWARGDYQVLVAVINASTRPVALGPGRLAFLVYRKGSPLPCSGQAAPIALPQVLLPGTTRVVRAPVACAPSSEGQYEIVGQLSLDEAGEPVEIGRIGLLVTSDPRLYAPLPMP